MAQLPISQEIGSLRGFGILENQNKQVPLKRDLFSIFLLILRLFHRDRLREVSGLVDIATPHDRDVVGKEL